MTTATPRADSRNLTSKDLESYLNAVPALCRKFGIHLGPEAVTRPADIYISASTCSMEEALETAAVSGSLAIFPALLRFDPDEILAEDSESREIPQVAETFGQLAENVAN